MLLREVFELPNIFTVSGYRVYFWANENNEPIHVHISKGAPVPNIARRLHEGDFGFAGTLLETLTRCHSRAGIMLSSSVQATLAGRFGNSPYGSSKKAGRSVSTSVSQASRRASIGSRMRRGRSGKLRGVAEPAGADARIRDDGETV